MAYHETFGLWFRPQGPGGDNYDDPGEKKCYEQGVDYEMAPKEGNIQACINLKEKRRAIFQNLFNFSTWERCTVGEEVCWDLCNPSGTTCTEVCEYVKDTTECMDIGNIGIKMAPLFGKPYNCNEPLEEGSDEKDGLCGNAYLTYAYKSTLSPEEAASKDVGAADPDRTLMFYIGTPCTLNLISESGLQMPVSVTCLWDATPEHLNYRLQAKDRAPGQEDFPQTFKDFWEGVLKGIKVSSEKYPFLD
jgi:hypothetical protein